MVSSEDLQYGGILSDYVVEEIKRRKNPIDIAYGLADKNGLELQQARDFVKMVVDKKAEGEGMLDEQGQRAERLVVLRQMFADAQANGDLDLMVKIDNEIAKTKGTNAPIVVQNEMTLKDYEVFDGRDVVMSLAMEALRGGKVQDAEIMEPEKLPEKKET